MGEQPAVEPLTARRQSFKIRENTGFVGDDPVVAQDVFVDNHCLLDIGYTD
ncbi:hypothetical protein SDC9_109541 [bioreactor metagenome]|uniref:Uncharacterized protein n=1 Tax=bioreactor metagenome TaxID=1076179 RepID=A0A645BLG6_9ZZZZ